MKKVLILGAGLISGPCVGYLLERPDISVTVMDVDAHSVDRVATAHPRAQARVMDARQVTGEVIAAYDIVISLLPAILNPQLAGHCLSAHRPLIAPSVVVPDSDLPDLDQRCREAGIPILAEIGLDPGIDHMLAAKTVREARAAGGEVTGFYSWCGGFPAPEANTNPFGYKFSWYPLGALMASVRPAAYLKDSDRVVVDGRHLLEEYSLKHIEGVGWFEEYPNGDSIRYLDQYGIPEARSIYRATLRYTGWCETILKLLDLGMVDDREQDVDGLTYRDFVARQSGCPEGEDVVDHLSRYLGVPSYSAVMKRIQWLGLLDRIPLPAGRCSPGGLIRDLLMSRLSYQGEERDMVVMQHEFLVHHPETGQRKRLVELMVDHGIPGGDSAMARGTGLPPAIAALLVLDRKIDLDGVLLPVHPEIYEPILQELQRCGFSFGEREEDVE